MHRSPRRRTHAAIGAMALCAALLAAAWAAGAERQIPCRLTYATTEGLFVDAGSDEGLENGATGLLMQGGKVFARVRVQSVASGSALLEVVTPLASSMPAAGESVTLVVEGGAASAATEKPPSPTLRRQAVDDGEEPFVPLLAPPRLPVEAATETVNIFHGRLTLAQALQLSDADLFDYSITRLRSNATVERLAGGPWTLEWAGELSYRSGDALRDNRDHEDVRLEVPLMALSRLFADESRVIAGRFIPRELPAVGFLDGVHFEKVVGGSLRAGAMAGFKPTRDDLNVTLQEPALASYATIRLGDRERWSYSGTIGALFTLFDGEPDRLAILIDQALRIDRLSVLASSEIDFDAGRAETYDVARLTRLDLAAFYPAADWMQLRAGIHRFSLPDTEAERDLIAEGALDPEDFLEDGYWRFSAGASHGLPWRLRLSEEVSFTLSDRSDDRLRWIVGLTRLGLPFLPDGSITATVYNIESDQTRGYGARLSMQIPLLEHRLIVQPSAAFRFAAYETEGENFFDRVDEDFTVAEASLLAHWNISRSWIAHAGFTYSFTDDPDRFLIDVGVTFRW